MEKLLAKFITNITTEISVPLFSIELVFKWEALNAKAIFDTHELGYSLYVNDKVLHFNTNNFSKLERSGFSINKANLEEVRIQIESQNDTTYFKGIFSSIKENSFIDSNSKEVLNYINKSFEEIILEIHTVIFNKLISLKSELLSSLGYINVDYPITTKAIMKLKSNHYGVNDLLLGSFFDINTNHSDILEKDYKYSFYRKVNFVIPYFESGDSIIKTLLSINSQKGLTEKYKESIKVFLIDDGSNDNLDGKIEQIQNDLRYELIILSTSKQFYISAARNLGLQLVDSEIVIFLDSDIVLEPNYVVNHLIRHHILGNIVTVSLRENVDPKADFISQEKITAGLEQKASLEKDSRSRASYNLSWQGIYKVKEPITTSAISDTDYFRNFGNLKLIGPTDLSFMVKGHNIVANTSLVKRNGGFNQNFKGWGPEDVLFGAEMIANGSFIIPILSTGVFHLNHPPRSGSEEKKNQELIRNVDVYKKYINEQRYEQ